MGQGAYILGCEGLTLSAREAAFFAQSQPWGFILFARNVDTPDQLRALTQALRDSVGRDAPILIDQEGGRVARMGAPHWRQWLPPLEQVLGAGDGAARAMWLRYRIIADELRSVGIDANCAPQADVAFGATHPFLRNRCYGQDVDTVARISRAVADGLLAGGVLPVLKHIPGHGRSVVDSHKDLPRVDADLADLSATDFAPFKALADLPLGMTAHLVYSAIDERVATMSAPVIGLIREQIGFDGLLMCDDISMGALSGTMAQKCIGALAAGCDVILHCNGDLEEMREVADVSGKMGGQTQARADAAIAARKPAEPIDISAAEAEFHSLAKGGARV
ncbi:MAG: beta-hexosaminidase [Marinosulfonomonas sp.]|nr:beta-hexosaminidase [Marinosulfonomonas sp.]